MGQLLMRRPHLNDVPQAPLPDGFQVREASARPADEVELAKVLSEAFHESWTRETVEERLTHAKDVKAVYVVSGPHGTVATASSRYLPDRFPSEGYVHWVATLPSQTQRGLASYLIARLLCDFQERGYIAAVLETDDFRVPAIRTYLKMGFIPLYEVGQEDHRDRWSAVFQEVLASRRNGSPKI